MPYCIPSAGGFSFHRRNRHTRSPGEAERQLGMALWDLVSNAREWRYRQVSSMRLFEGPRARLRVSLDLLLPPDPALAYVPSEIMFSRIEDVQGPLIAFVGFIKKGPMKNFDIATEDGSPAVVLGVSESIDMATDVLEAALSTVECKERVVLREALRQGVDNPPVKAREVARSLMTNGTYGNWQLFNSADLSKEASALLSHLAESFLLLALLPSDYGGRRRILKYSRHWEMEHDWPMRKTVLAATGIRNASLDIPIGDAAESVSFHLEIHIPSGIDGLSLKMPETAQSGGISGYNSQTQEGGTVLHAVGRYSSPPTTGAVVEFRVPLTGLRLITTCTVFATMSIFLLALLLPGAVPTLRAGTDGASALLLAGPAIVIALLLRPGENTLVSRLMLPLRACAMVCSGMLLIAAFSLVGELQDPWFTPLWSSCAATCVLLLLWCMFSGVRTGFQRTRVWLTGGWRS